MFCFQCEQTLGGKGCTRVGVCGKTPDVAALQDLLIYQLKGIGFYGNKLVDAGRTIDARVQRFVVDALFATLTNVNFDEDRFVVWLREAQQVKEGLKTAAGDVQGETREALYVLPETKEEMEADAVLANILVDRGMDEDVRSLRETVVYGLKGLAAYAFHAWELGQTSPEVNNFLFKALAAVTDANNGVPQLFDLAMEAGQVNLKCMEMLDRANTGTYGHPEPTQVLTTKKKGPFIVVTGHDLKDLEALLQQSEGKGVNIYTHGEMLPAHAYPGLKKYPHLVGNYGTAWQNQQKEFEELPGSVLYTTNCLQKPRESYGDRVFTTAVVGWPGTSHVEAVDGKKDFSPLIAKALELGGWQEEEPEKRILVGFGHHATLSHAGEIIEAVKSGAIKHFFLIGGCDGAMPGRNYYTEFATTAPQDSVILTLACGKYRFNDRDFGTVAGLPRLLDMGQCNDAFSAVKVALALAEAFDCSVNDLPLSLVLSWFEQKAVIILLTLLSLGVKNIRVGPSVPAFFSPNVLQVLVDKFQLTPISNPEADMAAMLS